MAPELVGNGTRFLVSEMSGRSTIELKATQLGIELDAETLGEIVETLKELEYAGYHFEAADASLELLMRAAAGWQHGYFELESFSVDVGHRSGSGSRAWNEVAVEVETEATVKVLVRVSVSWPSARAMVRSTPSTPHSGLPGWSASGTRPLTPDRFQGPGVGDP
ncbi:MAG: hypothetical protein Ct9H300mP12_17520 [Acidimicrobiales bacterium]|nr:MAG: hypothetical protein Ct9H300mP12_17520 [Acidimicrobiales bacterium]